MPFAPVAVVLERRERAPLLVRDQKLVGPEGRDRRLDLAQPGLVDAQAFEEAEERFDPLRAEHLLREDGRDADLDAAGLPEDLDGPERRPERSRVSPGPVVPSSSQWSRLTETENRPASLSPAARPGVSPHPVVKSLTAQSREAAFVISTISLFSRGSPPVNPSQKTPELPELPDDAEDGRRVHGRALPAAVVTIGAVLGASVRQADLGVGRPLRPGDEVLVDEPAVGPAVERRQVGMDDEMPARLLDAEGPHITAEEPDRPGAAP